MRAVATILFILLIVLQAQLWFGSHGVFRLWALEGDTESLREKNNMLVERNEQLHAEVLELKAGKEALEEHARSHLGFIREGEKFYRVVPQSSEQ